MLCRLVMVALVFLGLAGCASVAPPAPPAPPPGLRLATDFPLGSDREHLAIGYALGHFGYPGERTATFYQFADHPFNIGPGWCTTLREKTAQNWAHMRWRLTVDGVEVPLADYPLSDGDRVTGVCRVWLVVITAATPGDHELVYTLTLDEAIGDGTYRYPPGQYITRIRLHSIVREAPRPTPAPPRPLPLLPDRIT